MDNGADHCQTNFCCSFPLTRALHPGQMHPSTFDFFLLKVITLYYFKLTRLSNQHLLAAVLALRLF